MMLYIHHHNLSVWLHMIVQERGTLSMVGQQLVVLRITQQQHLVWLQQARQSAKVQPVRHIVQCTEGHGVFIQQRRYQQDLHIISTMSLQARVIVIPTMQRGADIHSSVGRLAVQRPVHLAVAFH